MTARDSIDNRANGQHSAVDAPHEADEMTAQLDLNHATAPQLARVADLEDGAANELVRHRTLHGHFTSWADVQRAVELDADSMHRLRQCARIAGPGV